ncbi:MAG: asparagine synthase [Clostridia bacterium]|nr:asparagine synthase [Clostridia bacterium]
MTEDVNYCASSFFQFRMIENEDKTFKNGVAPRRFNIPANRTPVHNSEELEFALRKALGDIRDFSKCALMLSSGIDSAILAKMLPRGTKAYTLRCVAEGAVDETAQAAAYAAECGLDHEIINISWEDYQKYTPELLIHMGQPIHSIEPQLYKAALIARKAGYEKLIFGETADIIYGGHSIQLCREFQLDEYIEYHNFVDPTKALKNGVIIREPYERHYKDGRMDVYGFLNDIHLRQSPNSYINSCSLAGVDFVAPYLTTKLDIPLDLDRIRSGENKYLVREVFSKLYPGWGQPKKLPLPRALEQWMRDYQGATRPEFNLGYGKDLTPDQKWYIYITEMFMDLLDR